MSDWDRIQRLELELETTKSRLRVVEGDRTHDKLRAAVHRVDELGDLVERTRQLVVELEAEIAACPKSGFHRGYPYFEDGRPTVEEL